MTLYDQLGGAEGLRLVVADFWARLIADDLLSPWYILLDDEMMKLHLQAYLAVALGGPENYQGRSMRNAHSGLKITGTAFDTVLARLSEALAAAGVEVPTIAQVDARLQSLRAVVVEIPNS